MTSKTARNWAVSLGLLTATALTVGYQSKDLAAKDKPIPPMTEQTMQMVQASFVTPVIAPVDNVSHHETEAKIRTSLHSTPLKDTYKYFSRNKYAAVIMDAITGEVVFGVNENDPRHIASLGKMMTLFLLFEEVERGRMTMDDFIVSSRTYKEEDAGGLAMLCLKKGEKITVRQAAQSIITRSAADVTYEVAKHIVNNGEQKFSDKEVEKEFARRMNVRAQSIDMHNTHYENSSGKEHPKQLGTAKDMAINERALLQFFPEQCAAMNVDGMTYRIYIPNRLKKVPGVDIGKTGYLSISGHHMAASTEQENGRPIIVGMGASSASGRNKHMSELNTLSLTLVPRHFDGMNSTRTLANLPAKRSIYELADLAPPQKPKLDFAQNFWSIEDGRAFSIASVPSADAPKHIMH